MTGTQARPGDIDLFKLIKNHSTLHAWCAFGRLRQGGWLKIDYIAVCVCLRECKCFCICMRVSVFVHSVSKTVHYVDWVVLVERWSVRKAFQTTVSIGDCTALNSGHIFEGNVLHITQKGKMWFFKQDFVKFKRSVCLCWFHSDFWSKYSISLWYM